MHDWQLCVQRARQGNPAVAVSRRLSDDRWQALLTAECYAIARLKGTERPFGPGYCARVEPGRYHCACCDALLFDGESAFTSGSGWPSFTQPSSDDAVAYHLDQSHGCERIEVTCNSCDAHLGHVFPDGPPPSGLRYCINAIVLQRIPAGAEHATVGGGCFWCTQAQFQAVEGVLSSYCGYSGGHLPDPDYTSVCQGKSGHIEVVQICFDPQVLSYEELLRLHLASHDPTSWDRQGADVGEQYRSLILTHNEEQRQVAESLIKAMQAQSASAIVTQVRPLSRFYRAEQVHQNYFHEHPEAAYCQAVIAPKIAALRRYLKKNAP